MEFLGWFIGKSAKPRVYSVKEANRKVGKSPAEVLALQNNTVVIDFLNTPSYEDPNTSDMCVTVLSSAGRVGTLSHLQINAKVNGIADNVLSVHKEPPPICLVGGSNGISEGLIDNIIKVFKGKGFTVSDLSANNNLGGVGVYRRVTLFPHEVTVYRMPYSGKPEVVRLRFPS